jgi:hypothetical protein
MTRSVQFRTLPVFGADERQVSEVVRGIMDGKTNNTGTVTLATGGATTTTLSDGRIGKESLIFFTPTAAVSVATGLYISSQTIGSATITHAANSTSGKTYGYIVVG